MKIIVLGPKSIIKCNCDRCSRKSNCRKNVLTEIILNFFSGRSRNTQLVFANGDNCKSCFCVFICLFNFFRFWNWWPVLLWQITILLLLTKKEKIYFWKTFFNFWLNNSNFLFFYFFFIFLFYFNQIQINAINGHFTSMKLKW